MVGDSVTADASGSAEQGGSIAEYSFDFGDGQPAQVTAQSLATHSYASAGSFTITVTVTDLHKQHDSASSGILIVANQPPIAALDGTHMVLAGTPVTFDGSRSRDPDGTIVSYAFDFFDGPPVVQPSPIIAHTWPKPGSYSVLLTVTDDRGATGSDGFGVVVGLALSSPVYLSNTPTLSQAARIAVDPAGNINVVWEESGTDLLFTRSTDDGATFSKPVLAGGGAFPLVLNPFGVEMATTANGAIHLAWTWNDETTGLAEVAYGRSTDGGKTFSKPVFVSAIDQINSGVTSIATAGDSDVEIAWEDHDLVHQVPAPDVSWVARSINGGGSFTTIRELPIGSSGPAYCPTVADAGGGRIYVAWSEGTQGQQIVFARSADGGATWSGPSVIASMARGWCPQLVTDRNGMLALLWDDGDVFQYRRQAMVSLSADGGANWSAPQGLSEPNLDVQCSSVAMDPVGGIYVLYSVAAGSGYRTYLRISDDGGATFAPALPVAVILDSALCPRMVAPQRGRIYLAWHETSNVNGSLDIRFSGGPVTMP